MHDHINSQTPRTGQELNQSQILTQSKQQMPNLTLDDKDIEGLQLLESLKFTNGSQIQAPRELESSEISGFITMTAKSGDPEIEIMDHISLGTIEADEVVPSGSHETRSNESKATTTSSTTSLGSDSSISGASDDMAQLIHRFEALEREMKDTLKTFQSTKDEQQLQADSQKAMQTLQGLLGTEAGRRALAQFGYRQELRDTNTIVLDNMAVENQGKRATVNNNDGLAILKDAAGNAQLGAIETDSVGKSMPELFLRDLANHKNVNQVHKAAKKVLKGFEDKDKELNGIEKLIIRMHDVDAKRYKILDTVLKGGTLIGFSAAGIMAILAAVGIIASAAATAAAALIGIPAGIMLGVGIGWFIYKKGRNAYQNHKQEKWLEISQHEGKHYDKMKKQGMSDAEIDLKAQHKLASTHPKFATLVLWNRLRESASDQEAFIESNTYKYLKTYGFKHDEMVALAALNDPERASELISQKLALPQEKESDEPSFG